MKKNVFFAISVIACLFIQSCQQDDVLDNEIPNSVDLQSVVPVENKTGENDGISYVVRGLSMVSDLVTLNEENVTFDSPVEKISEGIFDLSNVPDELGRSLKKDNILYIRLGQYTGLKKITNVEATGSGVYRIEATRAQLGEVFRSGTIDVSVDLYKARLAEEKSGLRSDKSYSFEVLNLQDEYDLGNGLKFNPATDIKMTYTFRMTFSNTQILPTELTNTFEVQVAINPALSFSGSFNQIKNYELSQYIPQALLDYIKSQSYDFKIPINTLGIDSLPAKLQVKDIKIPLMVEANIFNHSVLSYALNGKYKIGYTIAIKGLKPNVTPVYENSLIVSNPSLSETYGELLTSAKIDITPDISILDGAYSVDGTLSVENKTSTYANITQPGKEPVFGSKGSIITSLGVNVDLILLQVPVTIINTEQELWNVGTIVKSVVYSDLRYTLPASYTDDYGVLGVIIQVGNFKRTYKNTEFALNYKYQIPGKKIPEELLISYDIYAENGTTKLTSVSDAVIHPTDITVNGFKFKQDVVFSGETTYEKIGEEKVKIGFITITVPIYGNVVHCQTNSYIKNIVIRDKNGYEYEGIYNTDKGVVENSILITR
jgi:hypothetical protein